MASFRPVQCYSACLCSVGAKGIVCKTVQPAFSWLCRGENRMIVSFEMTAGMLVGRRVAAQGLSAVLASPQMDPPAAAGYTIRTDIGIGGLYFGHILEVGASFSFERHGSWVFFKIAKCASTDKRSPSSDHTFPHTFSHVDLLRGEFFTYFCNRSKKLSWPGRPFPQDQAANTRQIFHAKAWICIRQGG